MGLFKRKKCNAPEAPLEGMTSVSIDDNVSMHMPSKKDKRPRDRMSSVVHDGVLETAIDYFREIEDAIVVDGGTEIYIGAFLDVESIGGLSKRDIRNPDKGSIVQAINDGQLSTMITPAMLEAEVIIFILNDRTVERMNEYSLLRNGQYKWAFVYGDGHYDLGNSVDFNGILDFKAGSISAEALYLNDASIDSDGFNDSDLIDDDDDFIGAESEEEAAKDEPVMSKSNDVDDLSVFDTAEIHYDDSLDMLSEDDIFDVEDEENALDPDEYIDDDGFIDFVDEDEMDDDALIADADLVESETIDFDDDVSEFGSFDDVENDVDDEEASDDLDDLFGFDDTDLNAFLPSDDTLKEHIEDPESSLYGRSVISFDDDDDIHLGPVETVEEELISPELFKEHIERTLFVHDLAIDVTSKPFDDQISSFEQPHRFSVGKDSSWMGKYLEKMALDANSHLDGLHQSYMQNLRNEYMQLMYRFAEDIEKEVDLKNSKLPFGKAMTALNQYRDTELGNLLMAVAERSDRLRREYDEEKEAYAQAAYVGAQKDYDTKFGKVKETKLLKIESTVRSEIEGVYQSNVSRLNEDRREYVDRKMDYATTQVLRHLSSGLSEHMDHLAEMYEMYDKERLEFLKKNRTEDVRQREILERKLADESRAEAISKEFTRQMERMQDDFDRKERQFSNDINQLKIKNQGTISELTQNHTLALQARDQEYNRKMDRKDDDYNDLHKQYERLQDRYKDVKQETEREFEARLMRYENELASLERDKKSVEKSNLRLIILLIVVLIFILGFIGFQFYAMR